MSKRLEGIKRLITVKFERYEVRFYIGKFHIDINYLALFASVAIGVVLASLGYVQYSLYIFFLALITMIIVDTFIGFVSKSYNFIRANKEILCTIIKEFFQFLLSDKEYP